MIYPHGLLSCAQKIYFHLFSLKLMQRPPENGLFFLSFYHYPVFDG